MSLSNVRPKRFNKQIVLKIRWRNTFNDDNLSPIKMCPSSFAFIELRENCFSHSLGHILFSTDVCVDIFSNMKSNLSGLMQCIEMMRLPSYNEASNHQIEFFKYYLWDSRTPLHIKTERNDVYISTNKKCTMDFNWFYIWITTWMENIWRSNLPIHKSSNMCLWINSIVVGVEKFNLRVCKLKLNTWGIINWKPFKSSMKRKPFRF